MFLATSTLLLVSFSIINAQLCVPFEGSPLTDHICDQFVGPNVFLLEGSTQADLDAEVASKVRAARAVAPYECAKAAIQLFCQTAFLSCYSPLLPFPNFPCKSKCNMTLDACVPYASEVGELAQLDCNMQNNQTMQDLWPVEGTNFSFIGREILINCNAEMNNDTVALDPNSCPFPMELDINHTLTDPPCRLRCPLAILSVQEYESDRRVAYVLSALSIVCLVYVMVPFFVSKRKYPYNLFLHLFIGSFVVCITNIVPTAIGNDFVCHGGVPSTQRSYPLCGIQGAFLFFFAISATCWWLVIITNLYLMMKGKLTGTRQQKALRIYKIFAWGLPSILLIIVLGASEFSFNAPNILCFLPILGPGVWYQYGFFYIPIGIMAVSGAVMIGVILYLLIQAWISMDGKVAGDPKMKYAYYKIAYFGILFLGIWSAIFVGRLTISNSEPAEISFTEWVVCQVNAYSLNQTYEVCGEVPPVRMSRSAMLAEYIAQTAHGIVIFLLFCRDKDIFVCWKQILMRIYKFTMNTWQKVTLCIREESEIREPRVEIPLRMPAPLSDSMQSLS